MNQLLASFTEGTYRLAKPEETLDRITPFLSKMGITRCADVTYLDDLGIPVYCGVRPLGDILQVSSGKGLTRTNAKVSALMEAIELYHAENPEPDRLYRSTARELREKNLAVKEASFFGEYSGGYTSEDYIIDWIESENLLSKEKVWIPASAAYFSCRPSLFNLSTNGLASGNHVIEATLHAIYELIERDAIASVNENGKLKIKVRCRIIDLNTVDDPALCQMVNKIQAANNKLVLMWVKSCVRVHTFWAAILNLDSFASSSTLNLGYGTHISMEVAASRAITEAAQARAVFIHASREDIAERPVYAQKSVEFGSAYKFFKKLDSNTSWQAIKGQVEFKSMNLQDSYNYMLEELAKTSLPPVFRVDMTQAEFDIPVVKTIIPSFSHPLHLF